MNILSDADSHRMCPQHRRALRAYEKIISNPWAMPVRLVLWFVPGVASQHDPHNAVFTMLGLFSFAAFWGGVAAWTAWVIIRVAVLIITFALCQSCSVRIRLSFTHDR